MEGICNSLMSTRRDETQIPLLLQLVTDNYFVSRLLGSSSRAARKCLLFDRSKNTTESDLDLSEVSQISNKDLNFPYMILDLFRLACSFFCSG